MNTMSANNGMHTNNVRGVHRAPTAHAVEIEYERGVLSREDKAFFHWRTFSDTAAERIENKIRITDARYEKTLVCIDPSTSPSSTKE